MHFSSAITIFVVIYLLCWYASTPNFANRFVRSNGFGFVMPVLTSLFNPSVTSIWKNYHQKVNYYFHILNDDFPLT
jgi:uncharacterized membrane protein YbaN (DUF454 family)